MAVHIPYMTASMPRLANTHTQLHTHTHTQTHTHTHRHMLVADPRVISTQRKTEYSFISLTTRKKRAAEDSTFVLDVKIKIFPHSNVPP